MLTFFKKNFCIFKILPYLLHMFSLSLDTLAILILQKEFRSGTREIQGLVRFLTD